MKQLLLYHLQSTHKITIFLFYQIHPTVFPVPQLFYLNEIVNCYLPRTRLWNFGKILSQLHPIAFEGWLYHLTALHIEASSISAQERRSLPHTFFCFFEALFFVKITVFVGRFAFLFYSHQGRKRSVIDSLAHAIWSLRHVLKELLLLIGYFLRQIHVVIVPNDQTLGHLITQRSGVLVLGKTILTM